MTLWGSRQTWRDGGGGFCALVAGSSRRTCLSTQKSPTAMKLPTTDEATPVAKLEPFPGACGQEDRASRKWRMRLMVPGDDKVGKGERVLTNTNVPDMSNPIWAEWTRPLYTFLARPRSWDELQQWAVSLNITTDTARQLLAWLSFHNQAIWHSDTCRWSRTAHPCCPAPNAVP